MSAQFYGRPFSVSVENGEVVIRLGVSTLANAVRYADWANPFNDEKDDYVRTFAIANAEEFARDVVRAMVEEREDGSSLLTDFLDKASARAVDDGSTGLHDDEVEIPHGKVHPVEWANEPQPKEPSNG